MSIWGVAPVSQQPEIVLEPWKVFEVEDGLRFLVGWNARDGEGRVSSHLVSFNPATGRAVTASGRVYLLRGHPGRDRDAEYTWRRWCVMHDVSDAREVSSELWSQVVAAHERPADPAGATDAAPTEARLSRRSRRATSRQRKGD